MLFAVPTMALDVEHRAWQYPTYSFNLSYKAYDPVIVINPVYLIHTLFLPPRNWYLSLSEDSEWISVLNKLANISAWLGHILYCNTRPAVRIYLTSHIVMLIQISFAYYFMQLAVHSSCNIATNYLNIETIYNPELGIGYVVAFQKRKKLQFTDII